MKLQLTQFIKAHKDWEALLQAKPYGIEIKRKDGYILFAYSMIESDFSNPIVKECRGLILRESDFKPVCVPFFKFHNVQETLAAKINWTTARVQQKLDGSLIKVWFDDDCKPHVSTNGMIDAADAKLVMPVGNIETYRDLFLSAKNLPYGFFDCLDVDKTYMLELTSPLNRVVVPYTETSIWHVGTRNNRTLQEEDQDLGIQKPKEFPLSTLEECLAAAKDLPFDEEGYVIVDADYSRVKCKGMAYVSAHHLRNNGVITISRVIDLVRLNAQDDFTAIYEEYQPLIDEIVQKTRLFINTLKSEIDLMPREFESRKHLAAYVNQLSCPSAVYSIWDKKASDVDEWFWSQSNDRIAKLIGA